MPALRSVTKGWGCTCQRYEALQGGGGVHASITKRYKGVGVYMPALRSITRGWECTCQRYEVLQGGRGVHASITKRYKGVGVVHASVMKHYKGVRVSETLKKRDILYT